MPSDIYRLAKLNNTAPIKNDRYGETIHRCSSLAATDHQAPHKVTCFKMAILSQILIICMLCGWGVSAFALSMHHQGSNRSTTQDTSSSSLPSAARRAFVIGSASFLAGIGTAAPANALKQRNEALCGTGFFTNIAQYKCTEIGDISDEGKSKAMNRNDMQSVDSLLSKFGNIEVVEGVKDTSASLSSSAKTKANEKSEALASDRKGS